MASDTSKGFLDLPPELRETIYELVVLKPQNCITMLNSANSEVSARRPALACVNRQIRQEVLPVFYGRNTFQAEISFDDDVECILSWLDRLRDENVARLKKLTVSAWIQHTIDGPWGPDTVRRWIRVLLNMEKDTVELCDDNASKIYMYMLSPPRHPLVLDAVNEAQVFLSSLAKMKKDHAWTPDLVGMFIKFFYAMCEPSEASDAI